MNKANEIVFSKDLYDNSRDKMYQAISKQLMILMENQYVCKVYDDDIDIVVLQFEHDEKKDYWGGMELRWLTQEELGEVERLRLAEEEEDDIK
jgi:hypothetical protein